MTRDLPQKKLTVLHLVHSFRRGGAEKVVLHLCNYSSPHIRNIVGSMFEPDDFIFEIKETTRDVRWLHKKVGQDLKIVFRIKDLIEKESVDIVHAQGWGTYLEGLIASKLSKTPTGPSFIYAFHGKTVEDVQQGIPFRRRLIQHVAGWFSDAIIAPSHQMAEDFSRTIHHPLKQVQVIYNGLPLDNEPSKEVIKKKELGFAENDFIVGFVGRFDPVKNLPMLLGAFSVFKKKNETPDRIFRLLLVGDGEEREPLMNLAKKKGILNAIHFTGMTDNVLEYMKIMDVYLQPSLYEGHSLTILEAMKSKLPIIATNTGGTPEIIIHNQTGLLVCPNKIEEITGSLEMLYLDTAFGRKLALSAKKKVVQLFSVETMVKGYEDLYEVLFKKKKHP